MEERITNKMDELKRDFAKMMATTLADFALQSEMKKVKEETMRNVVLNTSLLKAMTI